MKKRSYIRIISFTLFALIILIISVIVNTVNLNRYKSQLEVNYQQSLTELSESLNNVNTDLNKTLYSNSSGEIYDLSRDIYTQCSAAKNAVSRLPVSQMELSNAYKFLSQAGDYAQYIAAKAEKEGSISDEEHKNLNVLLNYSKKFADEATDMVSIVNNGGEISRGDVVSNTNIDVSSLSNSFSQSAKTFESFPTLLYDGPFSDQVLNRQSKIIKNKKLLTKQKCKSIAANALGVNEKRVSFSSDDSSDIPCYTFKCSQYTVQITKQGGFVKSVLCSVSPSKNTISTENAVNLAADFLKKAGYDDMKECYYYIADNICIVSFAYCKNNVYFYPDLIKCSVSLEDGKLLSMDASTYLTNHTEREKFSPALTQKQCKKLISSYMKINSVKKCVIPKSSGTEVQCYEFACTGSDTGEDALIYINCQTGEEEDIMLLLNSENGTLVK